MIPYDKFREILAKAYPLSKGKIKLPIASEILHISNIDFDNIFHKIGQSLENFISYLTIKRGKELIYNNQEEILDKFLTKNFTGVVRVDCVLNTNNELKILEINSDYPDGLILHDFTYSTLTNKNKKIHSNLFLQLFNREDTIYIMYKKGSFFKDAYYQEYLTLKKAGFNVFFGDDEAIDIHSGSCFFCHNKIHTIKRCMEVGKFSKDFLKKLCETDVSFINSFDLRTIGYKNALSLLKSEYLPVTEKLTTTNKNQYIGKKNQYILKPSNLFEGLGIIIGKDLSQETREIELTKKANQNYVIQDFIDIQKATIKLYDDNRIVQKQLYFDLCPHYFIKNGKIIDLGLVLVRFSENKVLNVAQGGGIGYLQLD